MFVFFSNCYRNEKYYNENENFCSLMNVGTSKLALIFLVYCFLITLLLWIDYSHALKAIKSYKRTTTNDPLITENRNAHHDDNDNTSNPNRQESDSMFRRYRIPLIIFFTLSAVLYILYFVIIPVAPKVYTMYDRVVTYSLLSLLVVLAVLIIVYGIGLTYISRDYLKDNLKKASNRVTVLSCVSGVFVLIYAAWVAGNNTRVRLGYRLNTSWAMFLEQVFEAFSLSIMTYMLRSTGRKVPKWKKEMNKRMRRPIYDMTEY